MKKRLLALVLALSLGILGALPAFAEDLPVDDPNANIEFTIWNIADDYKHYTSFEENPAVLYLNKKFNVTIKYQLPPMGAEAQNFTLMLGTGDYTDMMNVMYSSQSMSALYEDGVIRDLAPYLEKYMPNYYAILQSNDELRKMVYDDEGHAFALYEMEDLARNQWGGMMYRKDILDTMTGGNVVFPSGNDKPTTVEDWDYMLPLMKAYFDASGMPETACLIVPACGYIKTGEILAGFGTSGGFLLSEDGKTVEYGPAQEGFYNYVQKMKEWYASGYIYADFASRTNDMFYLPNPALTYGGAAGVWFGLLEQAGDIMSMPEYGLTIDAQAMAAPLDTAHGITAEQAGVYIFNGIASNPHCISTTCDENKLVRILTVMDYLYSDEDAMIRRWGLNKEQAQDDALYQALGLGEGAYWFDDEGKFYQPEKIIHASKYDIKPFSLQGGRLPGRAAPLYTITNQEQTYSLQCQNVAGKVWVQYGRGRVMPAGATLNSQENTAYAARSTGIYDYVDSMIPRFIMGTEELNEATWQSYLAELDRLGLSQVLASQQSAYDRYLAR